MLRSDMPTRKTPSAAHKRFLNSRILEKDSSFQRRAGPSASAMVIILFLGLLLLVSKDAIAVLSLIQPPFDSARVNSNSWLLPNGTLKPAPKEPFRLENNYVHPPIAVGFDGYGDRISRATANVCLFQALDYALSTHDHTSLAPIDASDLDYTSAHVALNFHPLGLVIWEEWKNALYLMLKFVDKFDTREFFFAVEVHKASADWYVVGNGYLITF